MKFNGTEQEISVSNSFVTTGNKNTECLPNIYFGQLTVALTLNQAIKLADDLNAAVVRANIFLSNPREELEKQGWTFEDDGSITIRGR